MPNKVSNTNHAFTVGTTDRREMDTHELGDQQDGHSVATVMTDVLHKNGIMVSGKLGKIVRIFVDIGHIKNRGVIYWPKRIGPVIPTLWSGHNLGHKF